MDSLPRSRWRRVAGPAAGAAGLGAGHLSAALTTPQSSPILAVGSVVIDHTPTPLKEWAIAHFGSNDKTVLIASVAAGVAALTVVIGLIAARRRRGFVLGALGLVGLSAIAGACALSRPEAGPGAAVPSLVTAVVAVMALRLVLAADDRPNRALPDGPAPTSGRVTRRATLIASGLSAALAACLGLSGQWVIRRRARAEAITLPPPSSPAPALPNGLDRMVPGITPFRTPNSAFYRVDTRLDVPVVDSSSWRLHIDGDVEHSFSLTYADLLAMPLIERDITLTCVSNSVGGPYVGGARWLGVPLATVLERAGVGPHADQILSTDVDGMTISTPVALAMDGRDAMIAVGMNGSPLPRAHGFPARLVIPGLYGFISATKWVTRLTLTQYADATAYWTERGWATDAPIRISSRIDTPRPLAALKAGDVVIGGVAWAQEKGGVAAVEVQIDGGGWLPATLGPSGGNDYWRQWFFRWPATSGQHRLSCRVRDGRGDTQSPVRATPFPAGASGLQSIIVSVS
ncbi:molybdopterin-dependent oxidoreductase [Nocardioides sp.]|uniref:molybdopterin-dependent oxidoreductase n=1 Tax=Nocardioides sp. TaxID=35761 RepID=UPI00261A6A83|nr:molybdopterin-dependent oxidoreductase [Nocardioides sp.]